MFIQTEDTPNPNALKFLPNCSISPDGPIFFNNKAEAQGKSSLAIKLFQISDIEAIFFGIDFITITKQDKADWLEIKPEILMTIMDHLTAGMPILENATGQVEINTKDLSAIEQQIIEIIETRVRPSVAMDGGDITYKKFQDGIVYLELKGACSGCPSASVTLKNGIESMLQHFIPEVQAVEAVESST